jgi:hypothetical protein
MVIVRGWVNVWQSLCFEWWPDGGSEGIAAGVNLNKKRWVLVKVVIAHNIYFYFLLQ